MASITNTTAPILNRFKRMRIKSTMGLLENKPIESE